MSHCIETLIAAALAMATLGVIAASAHAADEFRCSISPCRGKLSTDGSGTTAHQIFILENATTTESVSFTCMSLRGTAEFISGTDVSLKWNKATGEDTEAYDECKINGSPGFVWHMTNVRTHSQRGRRRMPRPGQKDAAEMHVLCPTGQVVALTFPEANVSLTSERRHWAMAAKKAESATTPPAPKSH